MTTDYYAIVDVSPDASSEEIKKAYRRRARELHPDANRDDPETEERFKELTLAYETLRDPERRRRYDMFGPEAAQGVGSPFGDTFGMGDIFDAFFGESLLGGRRRGRAARRQGPDASVEAAVPFEVAAFGGKIDVEAELLMTCERCSGAGAEPGTSPVRCRRCGGRGEVQEVRRSLLGSIMVGTTCRACQGTGEEIDSRCSGCNGEGRRLEIQTLTPSVPAGVDDGTQLRLQGRGHAGARGGAAGDLYVLLRVAPHATLRREGNDLVATVRIGIAQAVLGTRVRIETLDGEQDLSIPPGTQPGHVFTMRGGGIPYLHGRGRGDLRVEITVDVPREIGTEEEKLLRRLAELRGEEVADHKGFFERIKSAFS